MSNEDMKLYELNQLAKDGNIKATFEIILMFEKYIDKNCYINGTFNQECKDFIIDKLIIEIKKFKKFFDFWLLFNKKFRLYM